MGSTAAGLPRDKFAVGGGVIPVRLGTSLLAISVLDFGVSLPDFPFRPFAGCGVL